MRTFLRRVPSWVISSHACRSWWLEQTKQIRYKFFFLPFFFCEILLFFSQDPSIFSTKSSIVSRRIPDWVILSCFLIHVKFCVFLSLEILSHMKTLRGSGDLFDKKVYARSWTTDGRLNQALCRLWACRRFSVQRERVADWRRWSQKTRTNLKSQDVRFQDVRFQHFGFGTRAKTKFQSSPRDEDRPRITLKDWILERMT